MKENRKVVKMLFLISQLGITMLTSIFLCMFIGLFLDRKLGTHYFFIPFLLLGIGGGFKGVYNLIIRANDEGSDDDKS
ncbi:MAG: AtpZ/AtpI family protein [Lachnospiraceae bacterium]|nr:AtpZ/AtpI family protein [Lachnospiraceae bacterium]